MTRCFIGLELPQTIARALEAEQISFKNTSLFKGNWDKPENMHVTLRFMGELDENNLSLLQQKLSLITFSPFSLQIGPLGTFPGDNRCPIRTIHAKVSGPENVQQVVDRALMPEFKPDKRHTAMMKSKKYAHHITICRVKGLLQGLGECTQAIEESGLGKLNHEVTSIVLFKSVLSKSGASYSIIGRYNATPI